MDPNIEFKNKYFNSEKTFLNKEKTKYYFYQAIIENDKIKRFEKVFVELSETPKKGFVKFGISSKGYIKITRKELLATVLNDADILRGVKE